VQSGEDNCARYYVSREKLTELRDECRAALSKLEAGDDSGAEDILPPTSGFFFGSTEIDSWYKKDLEHTINVLNKVLSPKFDKFDFTYRSSW
jgi:phage tail tape-measure protein